VADIHGTAGIYRRQCLGKQPGRRRPTEDRLHRHRQQPQHLDDFGLCQLHFGGRDTEGLPFPRRPCGLGRRAGDEDREGQMVAAADGRR
jgi:hypothetical protein